MTLRDINSFRDYVADSLDSDMNLITYNPVYYEVDIQYLKYKGNLIDWKVIKRLINVEEEYMRWKLRMNYDT